NADGPGEVHSKEVFQPRASVGDRDLLLDVVPAHLSGLSPQWPAQFLQRTEIGHVADLLGRRRLRLFRSGRRVELADIDHATVCLPTARSLLPDADRIGADI